MLMKLGIAVVYLCIATDAGILTSTGSAGSPGVVVNPAPSLGSNIIFGGSGSNRIERGTGIIIGSDGGSADGNGRGAGSISGSVDGSSSSGRVGGSTGNVVFGSSGGNTNNGFGLDFGSNFNTGFDSNAAGNILTGFGSSSDFGSTSGSAGIIISGGITGGSISTGISDGSSGSGIIGAGSAGNAVVNPGSVGGSAGNQFRQGNIVIFSQGQPGPSLGSPQAIQNFGQFIAPTLTVTETTTIDRFFTDTETILNSVPVTLTGLNINTVTITTQGVHQTEVDDVVVLTTSIIERPITEFVTIAKSNFVYTTEVSVEVYTITHSAHLISQTTFTTVVSQIITMSSPIVRTSIITSVDTSTEYRTIVNTVFAHGYN